MARGRTTITAALPPYCRPRSRWRRQILAFVRQAIGKSKVSYRGGESVEVVVLLYLKKGKSLQVRDVDNRLKDILDALQGRFRDANVSRAKRRVMENDRQVCRVVMEKQKIPKALQADAGGRLLIRPYRAHQCPLQQTRSHALLERQSTLVRRGGG